MAEIIPREFIELLLSKVDVVDLINLQVSLRKKSGSNYFARCPFHNEKSASFSVSQQKQFYYCFGCGAHGNAIDFMMQHDRMSFPEAVEALARHAGMEVPKTHAQGGSHKKDDHLPALYDVMTEAAHYYYEQMRQSQRAIQYLKSRGISGVIAQQFSIGYALPGWNHLSDELGKSESGLQKLIETGLVIKKPEGGFYDRFRDRILFPIHDYRGRIIGFGGRIIDHGEPKYLNSPETPLFQKGHELYGLYQALKTNRQLERALIVEGYMDVIALFQHGITYAVATLGTSTSTHHLTRLYRYTTEIVFCFDGDNAGKTAAWRALQVVFPIIQDSIQFKFLFLPDGEDPDSLVRKEGKESFESRIKRAVSLSTFFFQTLSQQSDLNTMEGRAQFASLAINHLKQIPEGLFQSVMLDELAKRSRIHLEELKKQILNKEKTEPENLVTLPVATQKTKLAPPMRLAIGLLIQYPHLVTLIKEPLPATGLAGHEFLLQLIDILQANPQITTGALIEHWRNKKEESFVTKLAQWEHMIPDAGVENEFLGAVMQLSSLGMDKVINQLLEKAGQQGLTDEEKQDLSAWIAKKKKKVHA